MSTYDFKYEFDWQLSRLEVFGYLQGDSFCPKPGSLGRFCLELELESGQFDGRWALYVAKVSGTELKNMKVNCYLNIENTDGDIYYECGSGSEKPVDEKRLLLMSKNFYGYYKGYPGREFSWPDQKVVIKGTLYFYDENADSDSSGNLSLVKYKQLHMDLRGLYKNRVLCDVTFCFAEGKLCAHKAILSCRSPVFEKMFKHDMLESRSNNVTIVDFEFQVFDYFLLFLYTDEIENLAWHTVVSLHDLADKYQVESLRIASCRTLGKELSIDSACSVLLFAFAKGYNELAEMARSFIRKNFNEIAKTSEWVNIVVGKPEVAHEI